MDKERFYIRNPYLEIKRIIIMIIIICLILTYPASMKYVLASENEGFPSDYLNSVVEMIKEKYIGDVDSEQLLEGALKGMFGTMDPYTGFFNRDEAERFFGDVDGSYEGIGVSMEKIADTIVISKVFSGSPAEKAGMLQGDKIVAVNGKSIIGASTEEVAALIKGEAGTKVTLGIIRDKSVEIINIDVGREKIKINPITYEIKDDIGYIKLEMFNANTEEYLNQALKEIDDMGINKIILDLRDNPGGLVDQGVALAGKFVPKGLITKLIFKSEQTKDQEYYSYLPKSKYRLAVLVNSMSASASEIVAGAIQDTKAGVIVGTKTFGKAKVQSMLPVLTPEAYKKYSERTGDKFIGAYELITKYNINLLTDEILGWTKITTGVYVTPDGRMIDGKGITPDVQVEDTPTVEGVYLKNIHKLTITWKPALGDEGIDVYNAEKILRILGYDVDTPDNRLDKKTYDAISKFRTDKGLYPGGVLDFTTQKALNTELERIYNTSDKQYSKAIEILKQ
ncbi:MAG TPA: S41 family peptidase [Clostridiales bacterium]|nr:S41 family peptidase [Clostridiales bacterium]